jgi:hypothetical protein
VSATPALIVLDEAGHASYAGEPGSPQLCSVDDASTALIRFAHPSFTASATMPAATGCFCPI